MSLIVKDLQSGYRGVPILKHINFEIEMGKVVGLVGLNGAGKSTLLKTILGLIDPLAGQITLNNSSSFPLRQAYTSQIAYVPETPILYEELTLQEHLEMTALGYGIPVDTVMKRAEPLLKQFRLEKHLKWFPIHFSKGMKQKVMIICAFVTDAKLMIIDEPFLGLDPLAIRFFSDLMQQRAKQGTAILFTTHVLTIAEALCDEYIFLKNGEVMGTGNLSDLQQQMNQPNATLEELYIQLTEDVQ